MSFSRGFSDASWQLRGPSDFPQHSCFPQKLGRDPSLQALGSLNWEERGPFRYHERVFSLQQWWQIADIIKIHLLIAVENQELSREVLHEQGVPCIWSGRGELDGARLARCAGKSGTAWRALDRESGTTPRRSVSPKVTGANQNHSHVKDT